MKTKKMHTLLYLFSFIGCLINANALEKKTIDISIRSYNGYAFASIGGTTAGRELIPLTEKVADTLEQLISKENIGKIYKCQVKAFGFYHREKVSARTLSIASIENCILQ